MTRQTFFKRMCRLHNAMRYAIVNTEIQRVYAIDKARRNLLDKFELVLALEELS